MKMETAQALPSIFNRALLSAGFAGVVAWGAYNHGAVETRLSSLLDGLSQVEMMGAKLTFDQKSLDSAIRPQEMRFDGEAASKDLRNLDPRLLARLLNAGSLNDLCLFDGHKRGLLDNVAADYKLRDLGLVELHESDEIRAKVAADKTLDPELGAPVKCYTMKPSARGFDVRTAVAYALGDYFARGAQPAKDENQKVEPAASTPHSGASAKAERPKAAMAAAPVDRRLKISQRQ